jgi:hypothetical protein
MNIFPLFPTGEGEILSGAKEGGEYVKTQTQRKNTI